jgi:hypothetical protein
MSIYSKLEYFVQKPSYHTPPGVRFGSVGRTWRYFCPLISSYLDKSKTLYYPPPPLPPHHTKYSSLYVCRIYWFLMSSIFCPYWIPGSASNHTLLTNENRQNFPKRNILKYFFNWSAHQIILFSQMKTDKLFQNKISWSFSSTKAQE